MCKVVGEGAGDEHDALAPYFSVLGIELWEQANRSTHGDERNLLVAFIPGEARRVWIKHRLPVHQKEILVVPMSEQRLEEPPTIKPPLHGEARGTPMIEITDEANDFRLWGMTVEIDRLGHIPGRITCDVRFFMKDWHWSFFSECAGVGFEL